MWRIATGANVAERTHTHSQGFSFFKQLKNQLKNSSALWLIARRIVLVLGDGGVQGRVVTVSRACATPSRFWKRSR